MENKLFLQNVESYIRERFVFVSIPVAQFIACLAGLESNFGNSNIALENHNIVGMKYPHVRLSTCNGENRGHASYSRWELSIIDFFYWCQYNGFTKKNFVSLTSFVNKFKKSFYNPSPFYCDKVNQIKLQYYGNNQTK